ncbi:MAG: class I SAM-dependent methyltransferase [Lachnospiraceae bacterium]|nr:class I SAM-dependent methyltransferase [Lachnospiraceae bacterium]
MKLSERLERICSFVPEGSAVADVGCDHAYVPIYLVQEGICPCAAASDIRPGPLRIAGDNIRREGLSEKIASVVCGGVPRDLKGILRSVGWEEQIPVTLITAGMGGLMMLSILRETDTGQFRCYVASPQKDAAGFRSALGSFGFSIIREEMVEEDGHFYPVILSEQCPGVVPALSFEEALLGPLLMRDRSDVFMRYLEKRKCELEKILEAVPEGLKERREEVLRELEVYNKASGKRGTAKGENYAGLC